ncbi:alpha/beta fold hydrolase [Micromonospora sp. LOL_021]|uniref:alpha/beta fold hydrolase n=1 Tax=Micromonospora sp. LOL_021 TaxID=3345417 RepID=UPI003A871FD9
MRSMHLTEIGACLRFHDLAGAEPAGVYLPGLASAGSADFPETAAQPPLRDRRWIVVDLLGAGFSDRPAGFDYRMESHAVTVAALLDKLGLADCTVVASSMGGAVAILLAASRPDLVGRLVLAEPALDPGRGRLSPYLSDLTEQQYVASGHRQLLRMLAEMDSSGEYVGTFAAALRTADPAAVHRCSRSLRTQRTPSLRETLYALPMPRSVLVGSRSAVDTEVLGRNGVDVYEVPDAGHSMMDDNPVGFAAAIAAAGS